MILFPPNVINCAVPLDPHTMLGAYIFKPYATDDHPIQHRNTEGTSEFPCFLYYWPLVVESISGFHSSRSINAWIPAEVPVIWTHWCSYDVTVIGTPHISSSRASQDVSLWVFEKLQFSLRNKTLLVIILWFHMHILLKIRIHSLISTAQCKLHVTNSRIV